MYNVKAVNEIAKNQYSGELCNGSTADSDSVCWGSNPYSPAKKSENLVLGFFYPSRRLGISSPREAWCISSRARCALVSHHAPACIFLRLDDIQCFALMICNSYGIDDIHAFGVIRIRDCEDFRAFRVCRQIRTGETLEMFTKLWYNEGAMKTLSKDGMNEQHFI